MNSAPLARTSAWAGLVCSIALASTAASQPSRMNVYDPNGNVVRTIGPDGSVHSVVPPAAVGTLLRGDGPAAAAAGCPTTPKPSLVFRSGSSAAGAVDPCGQIHLQDGSTTLRATEVAASTAPLTIDRMTTRSSGSYAPGGQLVLCGSADTYFLSDGSQWSSGAGGYYSHWSQLVSVEVSGTTVRYTLSPPEVGAVYEQTDYDSGNHSSQGTLMASGPLVLEAEVGSTTAVLRGNARVSSNNVTTYGEPRFNYFSAVVGSVVPFEIDYTISGTTWQPNTFDGTFSYSSSGSVDFAHPVSIPKALTLSIQGPSRVHGNFATSYAANVTFDSGVTRQMTFGTVWSVDHPDVASITSGDLSIGTLSVPQLTLTVGASFTWGADTLTDQELVLCLAADPAEKPGSWPMYQANAAHTGYLPLTLRPADFRFRWTKALGVALNPVAAGEGKVFATALVYFNDVTQMFALRASDGATLWTKGFGSVYSVNPPSFAYGNVYVQTGNHASDTWLHAFDGDTGTEFFKSAHQAQWERYYAPTVYEGKVYVDGGYYGGMYGFDAFSGAMLWYATLPQYDQWTPGVEPVRALSYVGSYYPGLYVRDRMTGVPGEFFVGDPEFQWNGWSMNLAPVVGPNGDVLAIHDGRLISFDYGTGAMAWEVRSQFSGQPCLAKGVVYAMDGTTLVALDELTHAPLWSWSSPGTVVAPMVVTDSHLFVSTASTVYAVDLETHQTVWSYAVGGTLALADDTLYIAGSDGSLTAISTSPARSFYTLAPCRVVDTRGDPGAPVGGPALQAGTTRTLPLGGNCGIPATAAAVSANVTVTGADADGSVALAPPGASGATPATVVYSAGRTRANNAILALGPSGATEATVTQTPGTIAHLIVDVNGYFQ